MKNVILIIILNLTIILINGCKKENTEPLDTETNYDKTFIIGIENSLVDITTLDSTVIIIASVYYSTSENFDLDKDGIPDFEIQSYHDFSPGGVNYRKSSIKVMNSSFYISTIETSDTLHRCTEITNDSIITYVYYNNYLTYSCDGIDTTYSPNNYSSPKIYLMEDSLTENETWTNEDLVLSSCDNAYYGWIPPYTEHLIMRGNWNNQSMKYLLFKKEHNGKNFYGWLKLSIDDYKEVRVYEYAIQKE